MLKILLINFHSFYSILRKSKFFLRKFNFFTVFDYFINKVYSPRKKDTTKRGQTFSL